MDESPASTQSVASVILRPYDEAKDAGFIFGTWRNVYYATSIKPIEVEKDEFFKLMTQKIKKHLREGEVRIACLEDAPDTILGYCVYTGTHLNWIHVKGDFRNLGIATLLFPKHIESITQDLTESGLKIAEAHKLVVLNPAFPGEKEDVKTETR